MNIYVGNLPYSFDDAALNALFSEHGEVSSATVIIDRETKQSKGFGFVVMTKDMEAESAITALNGQERAGRALKINQALPQEDRPRRPRY